MAVALTSAIGYDEAVLPVNGAVPGPWTVPFNAQIDSEIVTVISGGQTFWECLRAQNNTQAQGHASGATVLPLAPFPIVQTLGPSNFIAETMPREQMPETATIICTSTQIALQAVWLSAGQLVTNISVCTSATAASVPTHYALGLYDGLGNLCASSVDQLKIPPIPLARNDVNLYKDLHDLIELGADFDYYISSDRKSVV